MSDRDVQLQAILRIPRDFLQERDGVSIREALKRVGYVGYRPTFRAKDLGPIVAANPTLIEDWLTYSEGKSGPEGWYVLKSGEIGQAARPASRVTYSSLQEAIPEFVVRELDYWIEPDEFPAGWNKTISDLMKDPSRPVGPPETEWAVAYERSLLRDWARFPLDGEVYESLEDTPVRFLTHWLEPFTGGGAGVLPKGTKIRVNVFDWIREPVRVYAVPVDAPRIERLLISQADRKSAKYSGFSLSVGTADLNRVFRIVGPS
jgi:hypothetical protein